MTEPADQVAPIESVINEFEAQEESIRKWRDEQDQRQRAARESARDCLRTVVAPVLESVQSEIIAMPRFFAKFNTNLKDYSSPSVHLTFLLGRPGDCRFAKHLDVSYDPKSEKLLFITPAQYPPESKPPTEPCDIDLVTDTLVRAKAVQFIRRALDSHLDGLRNAPL